MKPYVLLSLVCLAMFSSCKKEEEDPPGTIYVSNAGAIQATPPPPGFTFPKSLKEFQRLTDFKIWGRGADVSSSTDPKKVFDSDDWISPFPDIILMNNHQFKIAGEQETWEYYFYQNGLYIIDGDTFPYPIAFGTHNQIELYDYRIKVTGDGGSMERSIFEKATKATLEKEAADMGFSKVDTMAYMNRSLILK